MSRIFSLPGRSKGNVLGPVNYKSFLQTSKENDKEGLTVLMGYSAAGKMAPPMIIYTYKQHIPHDIAEAVEAVDPTWAIGKSETGWMTSATFYDYMSQVFEPWLVQSNIPRPVLVYADGHKSHLSLEVAEFCTSKGILLVALYPNSTHLLQPLDVSVFKSLKSLWATAKNKWKETHLNENISKKSFPTVFKGAVDQITLSTVVNGFRKSGLYPLDPGKVDYSKCVRDHLQQECEEAELLSPVSDPAVFRMRCGLRFLEERIGHTKLQLFESAYGGERQGDIEDTSLYLLWSSAKEIAEASVDDGPSGGGGDGPSGRGDGDPSGGGNDVDDDPSGGGNDDDDPSGGGNDVDDDPSGGGHHDPSGGGDDDLSVGGGDDPSGRGDGDPSGGGNDVDDYPSGGGHDDPQVEEMMLMMAPQVEEMMIPQLEEMMASQVEEMMIPQMEEMMAPQVEEMVIPQLEEMMASQVEEMMIPQMEEMMAPQVEEMVIP